MATKPRGYFTMEQRDSVLAEIIDNQAITHENQALMLQKLDLFLIQHEKCQRDTCERFEKGEDDFDAFKRDTVKGAIGLSTAIVVALIGVIAVLI